MKRILTSFIFAQLVLVPGAQAQNIDWGELFGQIVGGAAGAILGNEACGHLFENARPQNRGFAQGVCAVGGAIVGGKILGDLLSNGNDQDVNDYMDCHRQAYSGPIGVRVDLRAGGYRGGFTPMREYRHRTTGRACRVIRYEAVDRRGRSMYRSEIREGRNSRRMKQVNYIEKFECQVAVDRWEERPYIRDQYHQYNGQSGYGQGGGYQQPGYRQQPYGGSRLR